MLTRRTLLCTTLLSACLWATGSRAHTPRVLDRLEPARLDDPLLAGCGAWLLCLPQRQYQGSVMQNLMGPPHATPTNFAALTVADRGFASATKRRGGYGEIRFSNVSNEGHLVFPADTLQYSGEVSLLFWLYLTQTPTTSDRVLASNTGSNSRAYKIICANGVTTLDFQWANSIRLTTGSLGTTTWRHVALIRSGTTGAWVPQSYLNGRLDVTASPVTANPSTTVGDITSVGAQSAGDAVVPGFMDDIMIYDRALSAQEVAALYADSVQGHPRLLRWWDLAGLHARQAPQRKRLYAY